MCHGYKMVAVARVVTYHTWFVELVSDTYRHGCLHSCNLCCHSTINVGSRPSDHYFRSVCWFVCLFVQSFSQSSLIRF